MTFKQAAIKVLRSQNRPMKGEEITDLALRKQLIDTGGRTPAATMSAQLYTDVSKGGADSDFVQLGKNLWGLREWDLDVLQQRIVEEEKAKLETESRRMETKRSIVGDPINLNGLTYAPLNENGVIYVFALLAENLGFIIEAIQPAFPDAKGRRKTSKGWEEVWIEFEYKASSFKAHGHDANECDLIVCWNDDWPDAPIEVLSLQNHV